MESIRHNFNWKRQKADVDREIEMNLNASLWLSEKKSNYKGIADLKPDLFKTGAKVCS